MKYFSMMKEKNLQPQNYPAKLSFRFGRQIKTSYREVKAERVQHHKTNVMSNVKGFLEIDKASTRNMKIIKGKISLLKANIL